MNEPRPVTEAELQAYADGVLADGRRAAVEAWLAAHPEDAESVAVYQRLRDALRVAYEPVLQEPIPPGLLPTAPRGRRLGRSLAAAALFAAALGLGTFAGWEFRAVRSASADAATQVVHRAVLAHKTYAPEVRHPVELGAREEAQLVAWLSKRLGMNVWAPNLDAAEMSLVGGRLLPGESTAAGLLMYEARDGRRATLYWAPDASTRKKIDLTYARENNVGVFYWTDEHCGYAVASADLTDQELRRLAHLAYDQLEK